MGQDSAAAAWIEPKARDLFLQAVADDLAGVEIGEGVVSRAIAKAFAATFNPPLETDGLHAPKPLRKLSDRIEVEAGDIRNPVDCERFCRDAKGAVLFHTAGIIHPGKVAEFYQINVDGTTNLLDAAIKAGVLRAVVSRRVSRRDAPGRRDAEK